MAAKFAQEKWNKRSAVFCVVMSLTSVIYMILQILVPIVRAWLKGGV